MSIPESDIINSATPLETRFVNVHPRLYGTADTIEAIRSKLTREPWAGLLKRTRAVADAALRSSVPPAGHGGDLRGFGCGLANLAAAYVFTREKPYFDATLDRVHKMIAHTDWTHSLQFGHWAHGVAVAYDWLYHELDEPTRQLIREALRARTEVVFEHMTQYRDAYALGYAWNHSTVVHAGLMAAACAIWGEIDGVGKFLRFGLEKQKLHVDALGSDGASAEGLSYGQYHADFQLKSMVFADQLLGVDFFKGCDFWRNYPMYMQYSALPREAWRPGAAFINFGDGNGQHWCGPDTHLRLVASRYRDGRAQWLANATAEAGVCSDSGALTNLLWHDESVAPVPPDTLPTMRHLADKDIVIFRDGWGDKGSIFGFKCGPNSGHHASANYRQNVSGGHMHPDAGHVLLHAAGDWLLIDDGYTKKFTSYQNTLMVNGIGQTGEGGTWFEDLEMRRGKPEGRIVKTGEENGVRFAVGDAAPAYEYAARLTKFFRHVIALPGDVWILWDELEAGADSTFELRFHAPRAFEATGPHAWKMAMPKGTLELWSIGPTPASARTQVERLIGAGGSHVDHDLDTLVVANATPARRATFVTVLHAHATGEPPRVTPSLVVSEGGPLSVRLSDGRVTPLR